MNVISEGAKLDIAASAVVAVCLVMFAVAIEISAPVLAGLGAVGAAVTGVARVAYSTNKK